MTLTRRDLLAGTAGLSVLLALGACSSGDEDEPAAEPTEADRLAALVAFERLVLDLYDTVARSGLLTDPAAVDLAGRFRTHHDEHLASVTALAETAGAEVSGSRSEVVEASVVRPRLAALADQVATLTLLAEVEAAMAATYVDVTVQAGDAATRAALMAVGVADARHAAALRGLSGGIPVPDARIDPAGSFARLEGAVAAGG